MIKRTCLTILLLFGICLSVSAADIRYKNIKDGENISFSEAKGWSLVNKKAEEYFTKRVSDGTGNYSEFYSPQGEFLFSTGCQYEFIYKGSLIGYSNYDLKFYEFTLENGVINQRELNEDEIIGLFEDFKIIKISDFTTSTNSLRLKKNKNHFKILLLNDTDRYFYHYGFTSNNAKFETYPIRGMLDITKKGLIQFSHFGDNTKENPWFILLVR